MPSLFKLLKDKTKIRPSRADFEAFEISKPALSVGRVKESMGKTGPGLFVMFEKHDFNLNFDRSYISKINLLRLSLLK